MKVFFVTSILRAEFLVLGGRNIAYYKAIWVDYFYDELIWCIIVLIFDFLFKRNNSRHF